VMSYSFSSQFGVQENPRARESVSGGKSGIIENGTFELHGGRRKCLSFLQEAVRLNLYACQK